MGSFAFSFPPQRFVDIAHTTRIKRYPDGSCTILCADRPIFREAGWEPVALSQRRSGVHEENNVARSMRRARANLCDIARSTKFHFFVTLTLNAVIIDRYDMASITKKLNTWLDNNVRRRGLAYILVPERHKDGAIHFHGFFNDALDVVPSGHHDCNGHEIYNLPRWTFGFTTAIRLYGDYSKAVGYVCKYIGKQTDKIGGRWYYSGGNLQHPEILLCDFDYNILFDMEGAYKFSVAEVGANFIQWEVDGNGQSE